MRESVEEENQALAELKNATLRNKNALQKENDKLSAQVESVSFLFFFCYDTKYFCPVFYALTSSVACPC